MQTQPQPESVEREVDMRRAGRRVFLVKAPVYLARAWAAAEPGADVGRLFLAPSALPIIEGTASATTPSVTDANDKKRKRDDDVVGRLLAAGAEGGLREHTISFVQLPEPSYFFSDTKSASPPPPIPFPSSRSQRVIF
jgi:hypothetical protein